MLVLYVIYRSGEGWGRFGLRRWRPAIDLSLCVFILGLSFLYMQFGEGVWQALGGTHAATATSFAESRKVPTGFFETTLVTAYLIVAAFAEELFYRGYLINRFSTLLNSYPKAILLSSLFFGLAHTYGGEHHIFSTFMSGLLLGLTYALVGRLWPTVFAHAAFNMVVTFHQ